MKSYKFNYTNFRAVPITCPRFIKINMFCIFIIFYLSLHVKKPQHSGRRWARLLMSSRPQNEREVVTAIGVIYGPITLKILVA